MSLYDPYSHAKIQAVSNESRVPAVYFRKKKGRKKKRIKAQADSVSLAILVKPVVENLKSRCGNVITDWKL